MKLDFSQIDNGKSQEIRAEEYEPGRTTIYSQKNQPMSLELKYKRSVPKETTKKSASSKSVNNPKKGILKKSSSFMSSGKKKPVSFKGNKRTVEQNLKTKVFETDKYS